MGSHAQFDLSFLATHLRPPHLLPQHLPVILRIFTTGGLLLRLKQAELGRLPSIAAGVRETDPAGPDRVAERMRKFVRLKFVLLKFVLLKSILLKPLQRLNLHGLQMLRLHPLLSGMRKQCFSLCCKAAETSYQAIGDHDATAFFKDGLSALQAYMLFVLHYLENYLTTAGLHAWPVISHNNLRSMTDRVAFTKTFSRPWNEIQGSEVAEVVQFLISRFVNQPSVPIGEREIGLLAKALLASKIPYQQMFVRGAQEYAVPEEALHVWEFPVQFFPGPAVSPNQWYVWAHGTTPQGLVGILTAGRVFRSDAEVVGTPKGEDCFSFYGKAMQWTNWVPSLTEFLTKAHHSTKNSSGVVVGGYLGSQHVKSKNAQTTHESHLCKYHCLVHSPSSDKRWAIREAGARIDRIWVLSSTHWSSSSSSANPFLPGPALLALDDDWGKNWPSPTG